MADKVTITDRQFISIEGYVSLFGGTIVAILMLLFPNYTMIWCVLLSLCLYGLGDIILRWYFLKQSPTNAIARRYVAQFKDNGILWKVWYKENGDYDGIMGFCTQLKCGGGIIAVPGELSSCTECSHIYQPHDEYNRYKEIVKVRARTRWNDPKHKGFKLEATSHGALNHNTKIFWRIIIVMISCVGGLIVWKLRPVNTENMAQKGNIPISIAEEKPRFTAQEKTEMGVILSGYRSRAITIQTKCAGYPTLSIEKETRREYDVWHPEVAKYIESKFGYEGRIHFIDSLSIPVPVPTGMSEINKQTWMLTEQSKIRIVELMDKIDRMPSNTAYPPSINQNDIVFAINGITIPNAASPKVVNLKDAGVCKHFNLTLKNSAQKSITHYSLTLKAYECKIGYPNDTWDRIDTSDDKVFTIRTKWNSIGQEEQINPGEALSFPYLSLGCRGTEVPSKIQILLSLTDTQLFSYEIAFKKSI